MNRMMLAVGAFVLTSGIISTASAKEPAKPDSSYQLAQSPTTRSLTQHYEQRTGRTFLSLLLGTVNLGGYVQI